jgi:putative two-component system response regulator
MSRSSTPRVLVVDDVNANRRLMEVYLAQLPCTVLLAADGEQALQLIEVDQPDLVLLDVQMPGLDGFEVCRRIKSAPDGHLLPVVMITALSNTDDRVQALEAGADDFMSKPIERSELVARARSALRLKALYDKLESAEHVIFSLAAAVEAKDAYTERHTQRVASSARRLGERLGLQEEQLDALYRGALVHDIGKIGIPDSVLLKPTELDPAELAQMRRHPEIGEAIIRPLKSGADLLPVVRHHHEYYDGGGYPDGLIGEQIPLAARIVAVCDAYDALVSDRPYRKGRSRKSAIDCLKSGAGTQWDPAVVRLMTSEPAGITESGAA